MRPNHVGFMHICLNQGTQSRAQSHLCHSRYHLRLPAQRCSSENQVHEGTKRDSSDSSVGRQCNSVLPYPGSRTVISSRLESVEKPGTRTSVVPAGISQSKSIKMSLAKFNILRSILRKYLLLLLLSIIITYHAIKSTSLP